MGAIELNMFKEYYKVKNKDHELACPDKERTQAIVDGFLMLKLFFVDPESSGCYIHGAYIPASKLKAEDLKAFFTFAKTFLSGLHKVQMETIHDSAIEIDTHLEQLLPKAKEKEREKIRELVQDIIAGLS